MISFFEAMNSRVSVAATTNNCQICNSSSVSICGKCNAVFYCSRDHQVQDHRKHRFACEKVAEARKRMETKEAALPRSAFKELVGKFDLYKETSSFLMSKILLLNELNALATKTSLDQALDLGMDCLVLARKDSLGVRHHLPGFMLQLSLFQTAYDFVKWWILASNNKDYDWSDPSLPFIDLQNEDIFEDPTEWLFDKKAERNQLVTIVLIKLVLFTFLVEMACMDLLPIGEEYKEKMQDEIHRQIEIPDLSPKNIKAKYVSYNYAAFIMKKQLVSVFNHVEQLHPDVWKTLVDPIAAVASDPLIENQPTRLEGRKVPASTALCVITFAPFLKTFRNAIQKIDMLRKMDPEESLGLWVIIIYLHFAPNLQMLTTKWGPDSIVWGKIKELGQYFPCKVVNIDRLNSEMVEASRNYPTCVPIYVYGVSEMRLIPPQYIKDFQEGYKKYIKSLPENLKAYIQKCHESGCSPEEDEAKVAFQGVGNNSELTQSDTLILQKSSFDKELASNNDATNDTIVSLDGSLNQDAPIAATVHEDLAGINEITQGGVNLISVSTDEQQDQNQQDHPFHNIDVNNFLFNDDNYLNPDVNTAQGHLELQQNQEQHQTINLSSNVSDFAVSALANVMISTGLSSEPVPPIGIASPFANQEVAHQSFHQVLDNHMNIDSGAALSLEKEGTRNSFTVGTSLPGNSDSLHGPSSNDRSSTTSNGWKELLTREYPSFSLKNLSFRERMNIPKAIKHFLSVTKCEVQKVADVYVIPLHAQDAFLSFFKTYENMGFKNEEKISIDPILGAPSSARGEQNEKVVEVADPPRDDFPSSTSAAPTYNPTPAAQATASHGSSEVASFHSWDPAIDEVVWARTDGSLWWPSKIDDPSAFPMNPSETPKDVENYKPVYFFGSHEYAWIPKTNLLVFEPNFSTLSQRSTQSKFTLGIEEAFDPNTWPSREYTSTPGKGKGKKKASSGKAVKISAKNQKIGKVANESSLEISESMRKRNFVEDSTDDDDSDLDSSTKKRKTNSVKRKSLTGHSASKKKASKSQPLEQIANGEKKTAPTITFHDDHQSVDDDRASANEDDSDGLNGKKNTPKLSKAAVSSSSRKRKMTPVTTATKKANGVKSKYATDSAEKRVTPVSLQFASDKSTEKNRSGSKSESTLSSAKRKANTLQPPALSGKTSFSGAIDAATRDEAIPSKVSSSEEDRDYQETVRAQEFEEMSKIRVEKERRDAEVAFLTNLALAKNKLRKDGVPDAEIDLIFADIKRT